MEKLQVQENEVGMTLLQILQQRLPGAPVGYLRQLLKKGRVKGENKVWRGVELPVPGEIILLPDSRRLHDFRCPALGTAPALRVLYHSREILIVDKPAGLAVHSGVGHERNNLLAGVVDFLQKERPPFKVAPIHRLDLETSGPVIFGKGRKSCAELGRLFLDHKIEKSYFVGVKGVPPHQGSLSYPVRSKGKLKMALTHFRLLAHVEDATLLEIHLVTGRQHQIRQQLAKLGHPVLGDRRYGGPKLSNLNRTFLHCRRLAFRDPFSGEHVQIVSELPSDLLLAWQALGGAPV